MEIFGLASEALAKEYGTPLYIMNEDEIRSRVAEVSQWIGNTERVGAVYAAKAMLTKDILRLLMESPMGLDVVSGGELSLAQHMGFPMGRVMFHGNGKTREEMAMALDFGVGHLVVDSMSELVSLVEVAKERGATAPILLRTTPAVTADTHDYIMTGQEDSKFGIPLGESLWEAVALAKASEHLDFCGLHYHIGSQIWDKTPFILAAEKMVEAVALIREELGVEVRLLNIGGGFAILYRGDQARESLVAYMDPIMEALESACRDQGISRPSIVIEPGRWLVGEAGVTLYRVVSVKDYPGQSTYVTVDGGMTDNIRPALYGAEYDILPLEGRGPSRDWVLAGKMCESGDILIPKVHAPLPEVGELIAVSQTGAYHFSMASRYNMTRRPAVVMVDGGKARLSVRRETYEDLYDHMI